MLPNEQVNEFEITIILCIIIGIFRSLDRLEFILV